MGQWIAWRYRNMEKMVWGWVILYLDGVEEVQLCQPEESRRRQSKTPREDQKRHQSQDEESLS